jgi:hypothetical protein
LTNVSSTQKAMDWLQTLLEYLNISPIITSIEDIHKAQHAIYEESVNGIDIGYYFGDYPSGKFSPELRDVQWDLHNSLR